MEQQWCSQMVGIHYACFPRQAFMSDAIGLGQCPEIAQLINPTYRSREFQREEGRGS